MIKPLNGNVILDVEDVDNKTESGLITSINTNDAAATRFAEVLAVSEDLINDEEVDIAVGDRIVIAGMSLAGAQVKIEGKELYAVKYSTIIGKL